MKFKTLCAAAALLATQSFAIIGVGGHYAPSFGNKMKGMKAPAKITDDGSVLIKHDGFKGTMQGFGFKAWIDFLPFIDIEGTFNIQFGDYDASLYILQDKDKLSQLLLTGDGDVDPTDLDLYKEIPLKLELGGVPFAEATPKFVHMNGDLTITKPFSLPIIRPYVGAGITYNLNTFILNEKFSYKVVNGMYTAILEGMQEEMENAVAGALDNPEAAAAAMDPEQMADKLASRIQDKAVDNLKDAALEEGLTTSIGFHVMAGVRAKLPIIPIAAYANVKYYFLGDYPSEVDPGNLVVEIGGGFAL